MRRFYPGGACLLLAIFYVGLIRAQTDVLTQHNDLSRTGWNNQETSLNTTNVNNNSFGLLYARPVDDQVFAQPLIVSNVTIAGAGKKNVLYVCTANNTIYAFDADDGTIGAYWQKNYTPAGYRPPNNTDMHPGLCGGFYSDFSSNIGLVGTPVIDKTSNTMYFVTKIVSTTPGVEDNHTFDNTVANEEYTYTTSGFHQFLHAVDLSTGAEKANSPVEIVDTLAGTGDGNIGGKIGFDPRRQVNRVGLVLSHGIVYVCFAAHCDWDPNHGWIVGFDATSLQLRLGWISSPNDGRGGIWMSGGAPSVDSAGNMYVATGNGRVGEDGFTDAPGVLPNVGESVVKLTPNTLDNTASALSITSFFTPYNYLIYDDADLDFGTQAMLVPNTNLLMTAVKGKFVYVLNQANLGAFNPPVDSAIQTFTLSPNEQMHSSFAYFGGAANQYVYMFSENALLQSYKIAGDTLSAPVSGSVSGPTGASGAYMSVSSNGSDPNSAILWISHAVSGCNANQQICAGILRAVRADNVTVELWNSNMAAKDNLGNFSKMNPPTIANGKVYVNTFSNQVMVYGLTTSNACSGLSNVASSATNASSSDSASSTASGTPAYAIDGNPSTAWTAAASGIGGGDTANLTVNLGASYDLCKVVVNWGSNYATAFNILGSNDGLNFTNLYTVINNTAVTNTIILASQSYRYVRMQGTSRSSTSTGYVINELQVFGQLTNSCTTPTGLGASNLTPNSATLGWQAVSGASSYTVQYKTSVVSSWVTRTTTANSLSLTALTCNTGYTYTVIANCGSGASATATGTFTTAACTGNCGPLPTRYFSADIGDIGVAGSSCLNNGIYTITGSGTDIGGSDDQFQYDFTNLTGDEYVSAEVLTQDAANALNKAGLMFRDSISNTSRFVFLGTTSAGGIVFEYRSTPGGPTTTLTMAGLASPYWIQISKSGTQYTASISPTGTSNSWTPVGTTVDLGFGSATANVGMAVTSHNNSILSTATFGNFTITDGSLPVKLLAFSATNVANQYVALAWTTQSELGSKYFDVQRSAHGLSYDSIGQVPASGTSSIAQTYTLNDNNPADGYNFYRLKIINEDGSTSYSKVVTVHFGNNELPQVYPNPAVNSFTVTAGDETIKEITLIDASGKTIEHVENTNGSAQILVNCENLAGGIYIVRITTDSHVYEQKLFKK